MQAGFVNTNRFLSLLDLFCLFQVKAYLLFSGIFTHDGNKTGLLFLIICKIQKLQPDTLTFSFRGKQGNRIHL